MEKKITILNDIKKALGIHSEYTEFDQDVKMHINSVFMILNQLGVGSKDPFFIKYEDETWDDFYDGNDLEAVKTFIYLKVRLIFDPPQSSFLVKSFEDLISEYEWRLTIQSEEVNNE